MKFIDIGDGISTIKSWIPIWKITHIQEEKDYLVINIEGFENCFIAYEPIHVFLNRLRMIVGD